MRRLPGAVAVAALVAWNGAAHADAAKYWVQIAASASEEAANGRLAEIGQRHAAVRAAREAGRILIYKQEDKKGDFWRVRIGPFETHAQAREYCGQLRAEGQSCLAVR